MKNKKLLPAIVAAINIAGVICLVYLGALYLAHNTEVRNPDAMLPMEEWEAAGMLLTIGLFPLAVANILAFATVGTDKLRTSVRLLFLLPSLICIALVANYWLPAIFGG